MGRSLEALLSVHERGVERDRPDEQHERKRCSATAVNCRGVYREREHRRVENP